MLNGGYEESDHSLGQMVAEDIAKNRKEEAFSSVLDSCSHGP